jgi:hypothetical protein
MAIGTKAYTLNALIRQVASITRSNAQSADTVMRALSPRKAPTSSVKLQVLNRFLNGKLSSVLSGRNSAVSGSTAKARLLNALRVRKNTGSF